MKYFLSNALFPFVYVVLTAFTATAILCIQGLIVLKIALCILNLALYSVVTLFIAFKTGQDAFKAQITNDIERRLIVETGENRPLKIHQEYKCWKGFLIGAMSCLPLILILIVHSIVVLSTGGAVIAIGAIANFLYMTSYSFVAIFIKNATAYTCFYNLLFLVYITLSYGITYILGAKKAQLQQKIIKSSHQAIYGDEKWE